MAFCWLDKIDIFLDLGREHNFGVENHVNSNQTNFPRYNVFNLDLSKIKNLLFFKFYFQFKECSWKEKCQSWELVHHINLNEYYGFRVSNDAESQTKVLPLWKNLRCHNNTWCKVSDFVVKAHFLVCKKNHCKPERSSFVYFFS